MLSDVERLELRNAELVKTVGRLRKKSPGLRTFRYKFKGNKVILESDLEEGCREIPPSGHAGATGGELLPVLCRSWSHRGGRAALRLSALQR